MQEMYQKYNFVSYSYFSFLNLPLPQSSPSSIFPSSIFTFLDLHLLFFFFFPFHLLPFSSSLLSLFFHFLFLPLPYFSPSSFFPFPNLHLPFLYSPSRLLTLTYSSLFFFSPSTYLFFNFFFYPFIPLPLHSYSPSFFINFLLLHLPIFFPFLLLPLHSSTPLFFFPFLFLRLLRKVQIYKKDFPPGNSNYEFLTDERPPLYVYLCCNVLSGKRLAYYRALT